MRTDITRWQSVGLSGGRRNPTTAPLHESLGQVLLDRICVPALDAASAVAMRWEGVSE